MIEEVDVEEVSRTVIVNSSDNAPGTMGQQAQHVDLYEEDFISLEEEPRGVEERNEAQSTEGSGFDPPATESASTGPQTVSTID